MRSWPLFDLVLRTPNLDLRLPRDEELDELAGTSAGGVLPPAQREFMDSDWTQLPSPEFERSFMQFHWRARADWSAESWSLQLVGFDGETPVAGYGLLADHFAERRSVKTGSWVRAEWRRRGLATEGRAALLELAFEGLGAREAHSDAHPENLGSLGVSRTLGYEEIGREPTAEGRARIRVRMSRERWEEKRSIPVEISGLDACRDLFGV